MNRSARAVVEGAEHGSATSRRLVGGYAMRLIIVGCALWTILLAAPALAQEEDDEYSRKGVYLRLQGSYFVNDFDTAVDPDDTFGLNMQVGYRLMPRLGVELQVDWIKDFDFDSAPGVDASRITNGFTTTANAKLYLARGWAQPYATAGLGVSQMLQESRVDGSRMAGGTDFAYRLGFGIDLYGDETMALNAEVGFVRPTGDASEFDYTTFSLGVLLRF